MQDETLLMEFMERVKLLENDVYDLQNRLYFLEEKTSDASDDYARENIWALIQKRRRGEKFTRNDARDYTIDRIRKFYDAEGFSAIVKEANRANGGGIIIEKKGAATPIRVKYYHSNAKNSKIFPLGKSEYKINIDEIDDKIDFCLFSFFDFGDNFVFLVFSRKELIEHQKKYRDNKSNILHLYFGSEGDDGKVWEARNNNSKVDVSDQSNFGYGMRRLIGE
jgi:hypothetical protein